MVRLINSNEINILVWISIKKTTNSCKFIKILVFKICKYKKKYLIISKTSNHLMPISINIKRKCNN